ncbi:Proteophosphoglycan 5 [Rhodotorula toruloides ATCC 204091]|uniref:Proteophosphoglycan 5 n=2 Tax=Rhodotorula toruloides TaxID=5286 RepID=A0A2T0A2P6_RHOTO|nr:Proteophosphoglycan 5 [Rhodotorula toruloides ATCC 204091]KAK4329715.1 Proteophosphoglycan 5 [Rhodotorula toruloides]PRQ72276.1 Proteophosphoglycan 5 [Rhodotorula toruloides]
MSTVSLSSHAGRPPPSLVSSSGVLATSPTSLRSPSTFTTVTASGHIPLQPSNFPLLHSLLDSPEYRQAMRSNPELARGSSRRHSKVVNQETKQSRLSSSFSGGGGLTSRAHASKSFASGSSVAGSIRRQRPSALAHDAPQQRSGAGGDQQQGRRTLPPPPNLPTTSADPAEPSLSNVAPTPTLSRSASMPTVPAAPPAIPQLPPTYPSRSFSHDPSLSAPPTRSSFRDAIDKLKRMLRRTHRRRRGRSGTTSSFDTLPSNSSMLDLADARSSRTSLMSDLSRLGDMAYVDVVAELERVEPDSTPTQASAADPAKPTRSRPAPSSPLSPNEPTARLEARKPAPSYAARTTDVEAWRESRRQFLLILEEGPPDSAFSPTSSTKSRKTSRANSSRPSLFQRRRPSFPSFARSQATVTPFSLDTPLERSRTLDDAAPALDAVAGEAKRRYSTYGSRWLEGAELVEVLSRTSGSVQAQEEKRVWRKWRRWVKERAETEARQTREGLEG